MTEPTVPTFANMEHARRQLRIYGYSLKKVDGEYIARPYGAKDDECTIYASDLDSVVDSARMDSEMRTDLVREYSYPNGMTVGELKAHLECYGDSTQVRVVTPYGVYSILTARDTDDVCTLCSEGK